MNHPKTFYHNYHAADQLFEIDFHLCDTIQRKRPGSVLDFGCGTGKNLLELQRRIPNLATCGIDMSFLNIIHARAKNNLPMLIIGDEYHLCRLADFDVVTTCSVLCHIQDITDIVINLKRIANKAVVIAETTDIVGEFYYAHDYEALGFEKVKGTKVLSGNDATYNIYQWRTT